MGKISYKPWVGKNYSTGFRGKKVLVLGESHYDEPGTINEGLTQWVIHDIAYNPGGQAYRATFTCFERAMMGRHLTQKEREEFWESVIFYNYLQFPTEGPRSVPKPEHWSESADAFVELLEMFMPDLIIVWGVRLFNSLPDLGGKWGVVKLEDGDTADCWIYPIKGKEIPALKIHHPSAPSGRNWKYWNIVIDSFFNR